KKEALRASFSGCDCLRAEARPGLFHKPLECRLVEHGDVGENLAINLDRSLLQAVHEHAVGHAVLAGCGIDAGDPQGAELALLGAAIAIGILSGAHHRFVGNAEYVAAAAAETLGGLQDLLVRLAGDDSTFDSWHGCSPRSVRQHRAYGALVGIVHHGRAAQLALALGALLGEDMAHVRGTALERAAAQLLESLGRAALALHLRHGDSCFSLASGACVAAGLEARSLLLF